MISKIPEGERKSYIWDSDTWKKDSYRIIIIRRKIRWIDETQTDWRLTNTWWTTDSKDDWSRLALTQEHRPKKKPGFRTTDKDQMKRWPLQQLMKVIAELTSILSTLMTND